MRGTRWVRVARVLLAGFCGAALLAGCDREAGPVAQDAPVASDPGLLRTKLHALMADECYADSPASTYPRCGKFFTQLGSTVGSVDAELAGRSARAKQAAGQLRSAVDSYQGLACETVTDDPTAAQRTGCPQALRVVQDSLDTLARA